MKSRFIRFEAALDIDDNLIFPGGRELAEFAQQRDLDIGEVGADDVRDHDLGIDVKLHETAEIRLGRVHLQKHLINRLEVFRRKRTLAAADLADILPRVGSCI